MVIPIKSQVQTKCRAKDPSKCWRHGWSVRKEITQKEAERRARAIQREREELQKLTFRTETDLATNLKLKTSANGETTGSVYRSGIKLPPTERGIERWSYEQVDLARPENHPTGRSEAIFATVTMGAANRWVRGNWNYINNRGREIDPTVNEVRINIDKTFIYYIHDWEHVASAIEYEKLSDEERLELSKIYWDGGMTVRDWLNKWKEDPREYDPREWEILINQEQILGYKPVPSNKLIAFAESEYEAIEVTNIYKELAKQKRILARRKPELNS